MPIHAAVLAHPQPPAPATGGAQALWQQIQPLGLHTVAVMGMGKNTGKTVCLNALMAQAHTAGMAIGLTSIGRDGEAHDEVFAIPKPPVCVPPGSLVATARDTLVRSRARTRTLGDTGVRSPMGDILIVKVLAGGEMEVAGASRSHDQHTVNARLRQCGADLVFLDGALGRSQHASPALADGVVLSTGAALGGGMADVLRKTRERLRLLAIASAPAAVAAQVRPVFEQGGVALFDRAGRCLHHGHQATLSAGPWLLSHAREDLGAVALSGAVGQQVWQALSALLERHPGLCVVVADGTKLFLDPAALQAFEARGGRLWAQRGIRLLGVSLNPFSPFGAGFEAAPFLAQARLALPEHHVTDVLLDPPPERT